MVEIRAPGAPPQRRALARDPILLGRAPRRGIAIPTANELADEHLILSLAKTGCHLALVPGAKLEPTLHGKAFRQRDVVWGDEVVIGRTSLRFLGKRASSGPSPLLMAVALGVAAFVAIFALTMEDEAQFSGGAPAPPPLFAAPRSCTVTGPQALALADEIEQTAMARSERYNFDVQDGIRSVELYRHAADCYRAGGDAGAAERTARLGEAWAHRLESTYQGHQLGLRLGLDRGEDARALGEVRALQALLRGREGVYMDWLAWLDQKLTPVPTKKKSH